MNKKHISILGSTGSIGRQAVEVIAKHPDLFVAEVLVANNNADLLIKQALLLEPNMVVIANEKKYNFVKEALSNLPIKVFTGYDSVLYAAQFGPSNLVLTAMVGFAGLLPTIKAIEAGKVIALANKETLVVAGEIITRLSRAYKAPIIPVDSEHSAIFQCLLNSKNEDVESIIITASGGSFRDKTREALESVTLEDALCHPNWSMGKKITIDSATMVNKGLEVIEAHYLFDISYDKIRTILHKESIIHSMVEFVDKSIIAQLGNPDMRIPIQYALFYPERKNFFNIKSLNFLEVKNLSFQELSFKRFPCLELAYFCGRAEGIMPVVYNASNEAAVKLFLEKKIKFIEIEEIISKAVKSVDNILNPSLDVILETDKLVKENIYNMYEVKR